MMAYVKENCSVLETITVSLQALCANYYKTVHTGRQRNEERWTFCFRHRCLVITFKVDGQCLTDVKVFVGRYRPHYQRLVATVYIYPDAN